MNLTPAVDPSAVLPEVEKMLYKLAHKYSLTYPIDYDTALAEAYYGFMRACYDYRPDRNTKITTWVYFWVWTHLKTVVMRRSSDRLVPVEVEEDMLGTYEPERPAVLEVLHTLSEDAREIIALLLETPAELLGDRSFTPLQLFTHIKKHLLQGRKTKEEIRLAEEQIRERLREHWRVTAPTFCPGR